MELQKALAEIKQGKFAPVYLLQGTEQYLIDLFKQELYTQLLKSDDDQFNFAAFDLEEVPLSIVIEEAATIPFFGDYRLVMAEHPYFLTAEKGHDIEHNIPELLTYLESPSETTVLVFIADYEKLDERKKVVKALKKTAVTVDVKAMDEKGVRAYVRQLIESEGYQISREAFDLLIQLTDVNLSKVIGELQKLFLFSAVDKQITIQAVRDLVPKSLEHNIFDMTNYVLQGKADQALTLYRDLLLQGEETIKINAILISQVRLLLQCKILLQIGYQQGNIADTLKIHPYRVKLGIQQVRSFSVARLAEIFDELVENDYKMKTGQMDKDLLFELFVLKLAGSQAAV